MRPAPSSTSSRSSTASWAPTRARATPGSATSANTCCHAWWRAGVSVPFGSAGYWRDLGQPHYYLRAHRELLTDDLGLLNDPEWPILTRHTQRGPARLLDGAEPVDSMVSSGCVVAGRVVRSVLGPGVRVEAGARVTDSVLFADVVVCAGAEVAGAIVDKHSRIGAGARVGSADVDLDDSDALVLLGRDSTVADGAVVVPGTRLEPGGST